MNKIPRTPCTRHVLTLSIFILLNRISITYTSYTHVLGIRHMPSLFLVNSWAQDCWVIGEKLLISYKLPIFRSLKLFHTLTSDRKKFIWHYVLTCIWLLSVGFLLLISFNFSHGVWNGIFLWFYFTRPW